MGAQSIYILILTLDCLRELSMQKDGFLDFNISKYLYDLIVNCRKIY